MCAVSVNGTKYDCSRYGTIKRASTLPEYSTYNDYLKGNMLVVDNTFYGTSKTDNYVKTISKATGFSNWNNYENMNYDQTKPTSFDTEYLYAIAISSNYINIYRNDKKTSTSSLLYSLYYSKFSTSSSVVDSYKFLIHYNNYLYLYILGTYATIANIAKINLDDGTISYNLVSILIDYNSDRPFNQSMQGYLIGSDFHFIYRDKALSNQIDHGVLNLESLSLSTESALTITNSIYGAMYPTLISIPNSQYIYISIFEVVSNTIYYLYGEIYKFNLVTKAVTLFKKTLSFSDSSASNMYRCQVYNGYYLKDTNRLIISFMYNSSYLLKLYVYNITSNNDIGELAYTFDVPSSWTTGSSNGSILYAEDIQDEMFYVYPNFTGSATWNYCLFAPTYCVWSTAFTLSV